MGIPAAVKFAQMTTNTQSAAIQWDGGRGVFMAWGTWGSGTLTLQMSPDDATTWVNVDRSGDTYCTLTANGQGGFELPKCKLRVVLSGSSGATVNSGVQSAKQAY